MQIPTIQIYMIGFAYTEMLTVIKLQWVAVLPRFFISVLFHIHHMCHQDYSVDDVLGGLSHCYLCGFFQDPLDRKCRCIATYRPSVLLAHNIVLYLLFLYDSGTNTMSSSVDNLLYLPREIWLSSLLPCLSLQDICRLDSASLARPARPILLSVLTGAEIQHEVILTPDVIHWITNRKFKPLRVKLIEDVSTEELLQFTKYNPQLVSLSTWDFDDNAQSMQIRYETDRNRNNNNGDMIGNRNCKRLDELTLTTILHLCPRLRCLRVHEMSIVEWCDIFVRNIGLFIHLDEVVYQESWCNEYFLTFYLSRTSCKITTSETIINTPLLTSIPVHYPALTAVELVSTTMQDGIDAGILALAGNCTALEKVVVGVTVSGNTLVELCRLLPNLAELQITEIIDEKDLFFW